MKQFSWGTIFRGAIFLGGLFPGGNFLGAIFPGDFFPGGIFPDTQLNGHFLSFFKRNLSFLKNEIYINAQIQQISFKNGKRWRNSAAIVASLLVKRNKKKIKRSEWVKPWLGKKINLGLWDASTRTKALNCSANFFLLFAFLYRFFKITELTPYTFLLPRLQ